MHCLNEYYKSHIYESITLKEKRLKWENREKKRVFQTHLRADFLERIVSAIRGFAVVDARLIVYIVDILSFIWRY